MVAISGVVASARCVAVLEDAIVACCVPVVGVTSVVLAVIAGNNGSTPRGEGGAPRFATLRALLLMRLRERGIGKGLRVSPRVCLQ